MGQGSVMHLVDLSLVFHTPKIIIVFLVPDFLELTDMIIMRRVKFIKLIELQQKWKNWRQ
jgi:hypothetical protein